MMVWFIERIGQKIIHGMKLRALLAQWGVGDAADFIFYYLL